MKKSVICAIRLRTSSRPSVTDWPMMLEWNCSRLVITVASTAVPIAPPRLRSMLLMPEAAAASCGAISPVVTEVSGVSTMAWPMARTMFGIQSWSPA